MNPSIEAAQMDPAIPEVAEVVELVAEKTPEASASERALITEFNELVKTPQFLRDAFEQMQEEVLVFGNPKNKEKAEFSVFFL